MMICDISKINDVEMLKKLMHYNLNLMTKYDLSKPLDAKLYEIYETKNYFIHKRIVELDDSINKLYFYTATKTADDLIENKDVIDIDNITDIIYYQYGDIIEAVKSIPDEDIITKNIDNMAWGICKNKENLYKMKYNVLKRLLKGD